MTTINVTAQTGTQVRGDARKSVFIASIAYGPKLETDSSELDLMIARATQNALPGDTKALVYSVIENDVEPVEFQAFLTQPYLKLTLVGKTKAGIKLDPIVDEIKQIISSGIYSIPVGVCPAADAAGFSGVTLRVSSYLRINDNTVFFLTLHPSNFDKELHRGYDKELHTKKVATKQKRNRRADANARLTLRCRIIGQRETLRQTDLGDPIPMTVYEVEFFEAYHYGYQLILAPGLVYRASIGVLMHNGTFASNVVKADFDGNSIMGTLQINALLATFGIYGDDYPVVRDLDGAKLTATTPFGQVKGLIGSTKLDLLFLFTDRKKEVFRTDKEMFISLDPMRPHGHLMFDRQSMINFDMMSAIDPATGKGALLAEGTHFLNEIRDAIKSGNNARIAEILGARLEGDEDVEAITAKFGLFDLAKTFALLNATESNGKSIGLRDFSRPTDKFIRYIATELANVGNLRIPMRPEIGASGEVCPDYSVLRHADPALDGRGFWYSNGALAPYEFSLAVNHRNEDPSVSKLIASLGIQDVETRHLAEGAAVIYRRPSGCMPEAFPGLTAVRHPFYEDATGSPFLFLASRLIEIKGELDAYLRSVLTVSKREELYRDFSKDGSVWIPFGVIVLSVMGWGDRDDIGCAVFGYLAQHITALHKATYASYPNADITTKPAVSANPWMESLAADKSDRVLATEALLQAVESHYSDNTIGILALAQFVYHSMMHLGYTFSTPLGAALRRTDDVIDAAKMNKGEVNIAAVERLLEQFWAEVKAIGEVPSFVLHAVPRRLREDKKKPVTGFVSRYDEQINELKSQIDKFLAAARELYVVRSEPHQVSYVTRIHNWTESRHMRVEMLRLRAEFKALLVSSAAQGRLDHADVIAFYQGDEQKRVIGLIEDAARRKACILFDKVLPSRYSATDLMYISVELYKNVHKNVYSQLITDENGRSYRRYAQVSDGQLFLPKMGEAFRQALVRIYGVR
jgi:hypothetical protein